MIWNKRAWIAVTLLLLGIAVIASLAFFFWRDTAPPSVPEAGKTVQTQTAVNSAVRQVQETRTTNDEAIKTAYEQAKRDAMALSADAVIADLNLLLDELRQRNP